MRIDLPMIPPPAQAPAGSLARRPAPAATAIQGELLRDRGGAAHAAYAALTARPAGAAEQALSAYRAVAELDEPGAAQLVGVDVYV